MHRLPLAVGSLVSALVLALWSVGCATSEHEESSGSAASGTGGDGGDASTSTTTSGGGSDEPCVFAEDCDALDDACNQGTCINGVCSQRPANEGLACDDGKNCTQDDHCVEGLCTGPLLPCTSSTPCHIGYCDVETDSCTEIPGDDGAPCVDEDACTLSSYCAAGECAGGAMVDCSFLNSECAIGQCDPEVGCITQLQNDGVSCDDGFFCTVDDVCASGLCKGDPNPCTPDFSGCMIGSCDEANNKCFAVPGNDGAACDDSNDCTAGETCSSGSCIGGQPTNEGQACDDADGCTSGTTCSAGVCTNATSTITQCIDADQCCPPGCSDSDCLFWQSGVLQNIDESELTGWKLCFSDDYGSFASPLSSVLTQCDKSKLLIACRSAFTTTLTLAAMGERDDVLYDCGSQFDCTHEANGVGFYYSDSWSWGFVPAGVSVQRNSCDVGFGSDDLRMCWHTGGGQMNGGYRCGSNYPFDPSWVRLVFEAD